MLISLILRFLFIYTLFVLIRSLLRGSSLARILKGQPPARNDKTNNYSDASQDNGFYKKSSSSNNSDIIEAEYKVLKD